jgi:3alpha(or 20beta)-hydroxysteroid dehydrogenase
MDDAAVPRRARIVGGEAGLARAIRAALEAEGCVVEGGSSSAAIDAMVVIASPAPVEFASDTAASFVTGVGGQLKGAFLALQEGAAAIRAQGSGGAVALVAPASGQRSYDTLRQGLRLLARSAALELGPEAIRVNIILPGAGGSPLGRPCTDADIAGAVAFAVSARSQFMTGADIVVDGGRLAQ